MVWRALLLEPPVALGVLVRPGALAPALIGVVAGLFRLLGTCH
jgi:hypothetical protein